MWVFWNNTKAAVTIEFILWLPFMVTLLLFCYDIAVIRYHETQLDYAVQDVSRKVSVGEIPAEPDDIMAALSERYPLQVSTQAYPYEYEGIQIVEIIGSVRYDSIPLFPLRFLLGGDEINLGSGDGEFWSRNFAISRG